MSDRFKSRAWDRKKKCMVYDFWDTPYFLHRVICHFPLEDCMQCTGLKDKKGKLIFEGDVVKGSNGFIGEVVYSEKGTRFGLQGYKPHYITREPTSKLWTLIRCEIIGNIHENPKLLKS